VRDFTSRFRGNAKSPLSQLCPMHHRVHSGSRRSAAVILVCDAGQAVAHRRPDPLVSQARSVEAAQVGQDLACPSSRKGETPAWSAAGRGGGGHLWLLRAGQGLRAMAL
jgi:hypothetical protein